MKTICLSYCVLKMHIDHLTTKNTNLKSIEIKDKG